MNPEKIINQYINVEVIKVTQSIGSFYIGKLNPEDLLFIANDSLSRLKNAEDGIQRDKDPKKIKEIQEYLKKKDATFPNSVIICIQKNPQEEFPDYILSEDENILQIKRSDAVANIIDGQHRLAGFENIKIDFELPISIFLDLSLGQQAEIFAQINSKQKKVSLDLVYELFGITEERTYEKVSFHIVNHLNTEADSAWYGKIKTLFEVGDIAQGSFAKYIHFELIYKGKILHDLYNQKRDTDIKNIIKNYFNAVKEVHSEEWDNDDKKNVLRKTTGFLGFSSFMIDLIKLSKYYNAPLSKDYFVKHLIRSKLDFDGFDNNKFPSGAVGQADIKAILRSKLSDEEKRIIGIK